MRKDNGNTHGRIHYAWMIFAVCMLSFFSTAGLALSTQGLFIQPVTKALNVSVGAFSSTSLFNGLGSAIMFPLAARILQKYNVRVIYGIGFTVFAMTYVCMSFFTRIWMWYITAFLSGLANGFIGFAMLPYLFNRWFAVKKSFLLGICTAFSSFSSIFVTMLISAVIERYGWRACYLYCGIFLALVTVPFVVIFVRRDPREMGLLPYGMTQDVAEEVRPVEYDVTVRLLPGEKGLFFLVLLLCMSMSFPQCFVHHLTNLGLNAGYSQKLSALLLSCSNVGNLTGKFVIGSLNDKVGAKRMTIINAALLICSASLLLFGRQYYPLALAGAVLCGLAMPLAIVQIPVIVWDMFDTRRYAPIYNMISVGTLIVTSLSGAAVGWLFSLFNSYAPCLIIEFSLMTLCIVLVNIVYRMRGRRPVASN